MVKHWLALCDFKAGFVNFSVIVLLKIHVVQDIMKVKQAPVDRMEKESTLCPHCNGSIFGPIQKSIRYNVNNARGNRIESDRSVVELFTPYRIDGLKCLFWLAQET